MIGRVAFAAAVCVLLPASSPGALLTVAQRADAEFMYIQDAIAAAEPGDTVLVHPGQYQENIAFLGKDIVLLGSGASVTTIDGSRGDGPTVTFSSHETRRAVLKGFTITGGRGGGAAPERMGGGILIDTSEPTIVNTRISNNAVLGPTGYGGGVLVICRSSLMVMSPLIADNEIVQNSASSNGGGIGVLGFVRAEIRRNHIAENTTVNGDGAGVWLFASSTGSIIDSNVITRNAAEDHGGGAYCSGLSSGSWLVGVTISQNLIIENTANGAARVDFSGGGVWCGNADVTIDHNTFVGNIGLGFGGAIAIVDDGAADIRNNLIVASTGGGILCAGEARVTIIGNLAWANDHDGRERCASWSTMYGNFTANPQFCDSESENYTLHAFSPALTSLHGPVGARAVPGCFRSTVLATWGALKARFAQ